MILGKFNTVEDIRRFKQMPHEERLSVIPELAGHSEGSGHILDEICELAIWCLEKQSET
jgi:hypothetical protein